MSAGKLPYVVAVALPWDELRVLRCPYCDGQHNHVSEGGPRTRTAKCGHRRYILVVTTGSPPIPKRRSRRRQT